MQALCQPSYTLWPIVLYGLLCITLIPQLKHKLHWGLHIDNVQKIFVDYYLKILHDLLLKYAR